jgi:tetratricopeptide (TPR) repeat protein
MASQATILDMIDRGYTHEAAFIADLSDPERAAAGTLAEWSAKDVIAHSAAWKSFLAERIDRVRRGDPPLPSEDLDRRNAQFYAASQDKSWEAVLADAHAATDALAAQTRALTDKELNDPAWAGATDNRPIWDRIVDEGYIHPLDHIIEYYRAHGQPERADQLHEAMLHALLQVDDSPLWQGAQKYNLACYHALAGDVDQALALLKDALRLDPTLREWSEEDADLDALRDDPRYQALYTA